jgi:hypothetical protein
MRAIEPAASTNTTTVNVIALLPIYKSILRQQAVRWMSVCFLFSDVRRLIVPACMVWAKAFGLGYVLGRSCGCGA